MTKHQLLTTINTILKGVDDKGISWNERYESAIERGVSPLVFATKLIANFSGERGLKQWHICRAGIVDTWVESKLEKINNNTIEDKPYDPINNFFDKYGRDGKYEDAIKRKWKLPNGLELQSNKANQIRQHTATANYRGKIFRLEYEYTN